MTRSGLIARLAAQHPHLLAKDAEIAVAAILDAIALTMAKGERVEIRGFGTQIRGYADAQTRTADAGSVYPLSNISVDDCTHYSCPS